MNLLDILFDLQEVILIKQYREKSVEEKYQPGAGNWGRAITQRDEEKMFDELDIDSM